MACLIASTRGSAGGGVLLIRSGGLGDMVLAVPVVRALAARGEAVRWLTAGRYASWITALGLGTVAGTLEEARTALLFVAGAGAERMAAWCDDLRGVVRAVSFLSDNDALLASSLQALGVGEVRGVAPAAEGEAEAAGRQLLRQVAVGPESERAWRDRGLVAPGPILDAGRRIWAGLGVPPVEGLVLHPGSGSPRKNLAPRLLLGAGRRLAARVGLTPVVLAGPAEAGAVVAAAAREHDMPVVSGLDLCELTGFLGLAAAVVTHDSGVGHLAAALGRSLLALFGPTDPRVWAPPFANTAILWCDESGVGGLGGPCGAGAGALEYAGWCRVCPARWWPDGAAADAWAEAMAHGWRAISRVRDDRGG